MHTRGLFFRLIGALLILALLGAAGSMLFRSGYSQGFIAGSLTAGAEGGSNLYRALPYGMAPYGWFGQGYGFSPFGPILGLLFFGGLIVLFFGFFGRAWRRHGPWQSEGGPRGGPEAWEERMKAWRQAHEPVREEQEPDPKEKGEPPTV